MSATVRETLLLEVAEVFGDAAAAILWERQRQLAYGGASYELEDALSKDELAKAAVAKISSACSPKLAAKGPPKIWPFGSQNWKPGSRKNDLAVAGAYLIAEIDRITRTRK
jgi:hypothetical protein